MERVAVSKLKASLSSYLDKVKAGEEVIVTERGHAIARVVPYTRSGPTPSEIDEMIRAGLIRPARTRGPLPSDFWTRPRVADPNSIAMRTLLEEREAGY